DLQTRFDLGRTVVHQVAHYLNVPCFCGNSAGTNDGRVGFPAKARSQPERDSGLTAGPPPKLGDGDAAASFASYMDDVDDDAMVMFTKEQVARMHVTLAFSRCGLVHRPPP